MLSRIDSVEAASDASSADKSSMRDDSNSQSYNSQSYSSQLTATTGASSVEELTRHDYLIRATKAAVALTLLISAMVVSLIVYWNTTNQEENHFQGDYDILADELGRLATRKVNDFYNEMNEIAVSTTSLTASSLTSWPQVTLHHFSQLADSFRDVSHANVLMLSPTVQDLAAWEDYAAAAHPKRRMLPLHTAEGDIIVASRNTTAVYNPVWEISPRPDKPTGSLLYMMDLRSVPEFLHATQSADRYQQVVISETITNLTDRLDASRLPDVTNDRPHSLAVQPIVESLRNTTTAVVGYFVSILTWESFLGDILHDQDTLTAVIHNTCGETFTYRIVGPDVFFEGRGDLHDRDYDDYQVIVPFVNRDLGASLPKLQRQRRRIEERTSADDQHEVCFFSLHIFPTREFHDSFLSNLPLILCFACLGTFVITAMAFVLWDYHNARRQQKLNSRVRRTNKIIMAMFPKRFRDELLKSAKESEKQQQEHKSFLRRSHGETPVDSYDSIMEMDPDENLTLKDTSRPLADLYVSTTVIFADISGFSAWSSIREPTQIFQLLEAIFASFDETARKMGVFKVETVGDCYVAVAGMPEPRDDHAVLMARFAQKCQRKMDDLMELLVSKLGPDTAELSLRCGLHSGPVTAGVLRGARARLQLFGDTMNTASRIETSGLPRRIHVSPETAQLIQQHKKDHWLERREDLVVAKGKGEMQTFWVKLNPKSSTDDTSRRVTDTLPVSAPLSNADFKRKQMNRLLAWNCKILVRLVQKIVHKRQQNEALSRRRDSLSSNQSLRQAEERFRHSGTSNVIGEIAEIISMSDRPLDDTRTECTVQLDPLIEEQIHQLVTVISKMYRDNPFHCFEHASHVVMATTKLLSRIHKSVGERDQTYGITADPLTQFSLVLAALIHDIDHRGIPNEALRLEDPILSSAYNHQSVAEQNSVDLAWNMLMDPSFAELRSCILEDEEDLGRLRQVIVNSVMATDIFDKDLGALRKKRWTDAFQESKAMESSQSQVNRKATIVIEHLIQASDIAHTMQHWHIYQKWNERLFAEMYQGFQEGRIIKDPSLGWYKGELCFFDNLVIPLTKNLKECGVFGVSSDEYLTYATKNRNKWECRGEEIVEAFRSKYKGS